MKILFVSEQFPYPLYDGGNLRTFHVLKGLAREHDVTLVSHQASAERDEAEAFIGEFCDVVTVPEPPVWKRAAGNLLRRGVGQPGFLVKNWSSDILKATDRLLEEKDFDAIHLNMLDTACFALARDWHLPLIFDSHNCLMQLAECVRDGSGGWLKRAIFSRETKTLAKWEGEVAKRMDLTLVCSEEDGDLFRQLHSDAKCLVAPNGVDSEFFRSSGEITPEDGNLVFTGSMCYFPNAEASEWFVKNVLPLLKNDPAIHVYLVGKDPPPSVQALDQESNVTVTGTVKDVRPYVEQAEIFIVPLQSGGGTRLKIMEAFAMGKAVVSTSKGAEGIPAEHEREILIADDPQDFANAIQKLRSSANLRQELGEAARTFIEQRYDWRAVQDLILEGYTSLVPEASPPVAVS